MSQITAFGSLPDGRAVSAITLQGPMLTARVLTLGAIVQDLRLRGVDHPLVLGFAEVAPYLDSPGRYVGAVVGRYANRIGGAAFALDGETVRLDANEGRNQLHGGRDGLHQRLWTIEDLGAAHVTLGAVLPDGHMGFAGRLQISARISVEDDALTLAISARTDAPTPCTLAHHGYFCLDAQTDIRDQMLQIAAQHFLPVDAENIPQGAQHPVENTAFDFRKTRRIGGTGYDHNFCLSAQRGPLRPVARLEGREGIVMQVETTEPGLQLYDGRHFDSIGHGGQHYGPYAGLALETQAWPDAPNRPDFPNSILRPGEEYLAETRYRFSRAPAAKT